MMRASQTAMSNATHPQAPDNKAPAASGTSSWPESTGSRSKAVMPWLIALALVVTVLVVAFAPNVVLGVLGVVVFVALCCTAVLAIAPGHGDAGGVPR